MNSKNVFTVKEIANKLDCVKQTVHNLIGAGKIRAEKFGNAFMISRDEFVKYLYNKRGCLADEMAAIDEIIRATAEEAE